MSAKLKNAGGGVDACAGLKLPENIAVAGIERDEAPIVAAGEYRGAGSSRRATVAAVLPALTPDDLVGSHVDGRKDTVERDVREAEQTLGIRAARLRLLGSSDQKSAHLIVRANKQVCLPRIVGTGWPIGAAPRARLRDHRLVPVRRENLPAIDQSESRRRNVDGMRH